MLANRSWVRRLLCGALLLAAIRCPGQDLGESVDPLLDAGQRLSPALRAAALETEASLARAEGADALDAPVISDSFQYYRDPGVFSGHAIMLTQSFPLWGKRDLRRAAALADADAARGREQAARDELDERIKVAFARYYAASQALRIDREAIGLIQGIGRAAAARYGAGRGDQPAILQSMNEESAVRTDMARLQGDRDGAAAQLNALLARAADAPLAEPATPRPLPAADLSADALMQRARGGNPSVRVEIAAAEAARSRRDLADKAWYPDVTLGAGPLIQTNDRPPGVAATVGITIPLGWGREESERKAAAAALGAARERIDAALLDLQAGLGDAAAKVNAARRSSLLIDAEALPRARALLHSLIAEYGQGRGDLAAAVMALHRLHDLELRQLQLQLEAQTALAAIERMIGDKL
jgi:cobalt-zinc-cadmium efflux system outer membrane protein